MLLFLEDRKTARVVFLVFLLGILHFHSLKSSFLVPNPAYCWVSHGETLRRHVALRRIQEGVDRAVKNQPQVVRTGDKGKCD